MYCIITLARTGRGLGAVDNATYMHTKQSLLKLFRDVDRTKSLQSVGDHLHLLPTRFLHWSMWGHLPLSVGWPLNRVRICRSDDATAGMGVSIRLLLMISMLSTTVHRSMEARG